MSEPIMSPLNPSDTDAFSLPGEMTPIRSTVYQPSVSDAEGDSTGIPCGLIQIYPVDILEGMLPLNDRQVKIGRDPSCDIVIDDSSVSRSHVQVVCERGQCRVEDMQSTNGTRINGQRVATADLQPGDTIQIGTYIFKYLADDSVESQYYESVYSAMTRDALTELPNRRYLMETLKREIARSVRRNTYLSVMMLDIDHFKSVNDTFGHVVGDEVLHEFGRRLMTICRDDELVARYGGEEFCFILADTSAREATSIAERCRTTIAEMAFQTSAGPQQITTSIGVAGFQLETVVPGDQLIRTADEALYSAKTGGRNKVVIADA